jgi:hypothetical protein
MMGPGRLGGQLLQKSWTISLIFIISRSPHLTDKSYPAHKIVRTLVYDMMQKNQRL